MTGIPVSTREVEIAGRRVTLYDVTPASADAPVPVARVTGGGADLVLYDWRVPATGASGVR